MINCLSLIVQSGSYFFSVEWWGKYMYASCKSSWCKSSLWKQSYSSNLPSIYSINCISMAFFHRGSSGVVGMEICDRSDSMSTELEWTHIAFQYLHFCLPVNPPSHPVLVCCTGTFLLCRALFVFSLLKCCDSIVVYVLVMLYTTVPIVPL